MFACTVYWKKNCHVFLIICLTPPVKLKGKVEVNRMFVVNQVLHLFFNVKTRQQKQSMS